MICAGTPMINNIQILKPFTSKHKYNRRTNDQVNKDNNQNRWIFLPQTHARINATKKDVGSAAIYDIQLFLICS